MKRIIVFSFYIALELFAGLSCSKSSVIEGVDTPYQYPNYKGYKGWLQVYIKPGGLAEKCELKIYEGVHYLGKVNQNNMVSDPASITCGQGNALQIAMPPGTYTIVVSGPCGGLTASRTIKQLFCTQLELQ